MTVGTQHNKYREFMHATSAVIHAVALFVWPSNYDLNSLQAHNYFIVRLEKNPSFFIGIYKKTLDCRMLCSRGKQFNRKYYFECN